MKNLNSIYWALCTLILSSPQSYAEFGVRFGAAFNLTADFSAGAFSKPEATDPGPNSGGADHFYDDGYNRIDSSGNFGDVTSFWGYDDAASQYNASGAGSITMNSDTTTIDTSYFSGDQDGAQPTLEVFWQEFYWKQGDWDFGISASLRWQSVEVDGELLVGSTTVRISDTYGLGGAIPPSSPFEGTSTGVGYALLDDSPSRVESITTGTTRTKREIEADLYALNFGPIVSYGISNKFSLLFSAGGTVALIDSDFSYSDSVSGNGSVSDQEFLLGAYAGADLRLKLDEEWAISFGAVYTYLEDFEQDSAGREATLEFDESFVVSVGVSRQF